MRAPLLAAASLCLAGFALACRPAPPRAPAFASLVDGYLDAFARRHPSIAAGNGLHQHDALLEDFSAAAIRRRSRT